MFQDLKKMGREYLLTGSIVDTVTDKKPTKEELVNLKLDKVLTTAKANFRQQPPRISSCRKSLIEVLVMLVSKGTQLKESEMTDIFFAATQLFQVQDWPVRRLIYVLLDTLNPDAAEAFIVTASLVKEVEKGEYAQRAKAIRRFTRVDISIASQLEGQIKNAILDKNAMVSSSALLYGIFLHHLQPEIVRRWSTEVNTALQRNTGMSQAHAARLLFMIKKGDNLALMKQIKQLTADRAQNSSLSPTAMVYTLQQAQKLIRKDSPSSDGDFECHVLDFFQQAIHSPSCSVAFQAAKSMINIATSRYDASSIQSSSINLGSAVETMKSFLMHHCPVQRFGAIRALHLVSQVMPEVLVNHTDDIQEFHRQQTSHPTLSILAISTLLNAGNEHNVDRLLEAIQVQGMADMPDGFRLDIIRAVRQLAEKFPEKYPSFLSYLQSHTREDRTVQFKELLIQTIIAIATDVPEAFVRCLDILCEFIEDSEYPALTSFTIDRITDMICKVPDPEIYVRFIFNRLILECANVRATALHSLTKLARAFPDIAVPIISLIDLHTAETDDSLRDWFINCKISLDKTNDLLDESTCASSDDILMMDLVNGDELEALKCTYWGDEDNAVVDAVPSGVALSTFQASGPPALDEFDLPESKEQSRSPLELIAMLAPMCPPGIVVKNIVRKLDKTLLTEEEAEFYVTAVINVLEVEGIEPNSYMLAVELRMLNTLEGVTLTNVAPQFCHVPHGVMPLNSIEIDSLNYTEEKIAYVMMQISMSALEVESMVEIPLRFNFNQTEEQGGPAFEDSYDIQSLIIHRTDLP